ncbi:MAG: sulfatase-like hydrolase/transferase [Deinococcota bacterium]
MTNPERPNLLYIHSDQHCPSVLGCYGDPLVQTPHLDRLAAGGTLFTNTYCSSPICVPSRMSMLTGRHPYQNKVWTNDHILDSGIPTHAHAIGGAGYQPVLIGRMHALGPDQLHGYADRLIGDHGPNYVGGSPVDRGVLHKTSEPERISLERSGQGQSAYQVHDEDVTAAAVNKLNQLGVQKRAGLLNNPFAITVGFMLPHPPYVAREEDFAIYDKVITPPAKPRAFKDEAHPFIRSWRLHTGSDNVKEADTLRARAAYWGLVSRLDSMIGQILEALNDNGLAENTLIVYTSDHGDMLGEHGLWWKHVFYEESVKVPLIMNWPGVISAGQYCDHVVSALDVTATLVDAVGAHQLAGSPGRSLLPLVSSKVNSEVKDVSWDNLAFSEYCSDQFAPQGETYQRMIRQDEWKCIYYHDAEPQLFNLAEDPEEQVDRANDPACSSVQKELLERILDDWNPEAIATEMAAKRADNHLIRGWAEQTQPSDSYRWQLEPSMNVLDEQ